MGPRGEMRGWDEEATVATTAAVPDTMPMRPLAGWGLETLALRGPKLTWPRLAALLLARVRTAAPCWWCGGCCVKDASDWARPAVMNKCPVPAAAAKAASMDPLRWRREPPTNPLSKLRAGASVTEALPLAHSTEDLMGWVGDEGLPSWGVATRGGGPREPYNP